MANRNFKASATCKSNIPSAGESPYTGDHARTWTRLKKGTVGIPPLHMENRVRGTSGQICNELLIQHQWGSRFRCSNKWPCLLKVGWPTVAISGYQHHIMVVLTCSALTYTSGQRHGLLMSSEDMSYWMEHWDRICILQLCPKGHPCNELPVPMLTIAASQKKPRALLAGESQGDVNLHARDVGEGLVITRANLRCFETSEDRSAITLP